MLLFRASHFARTDCDQESFRVVTTDKDALKAVFPSGAVPASSKVVQADVSGNVQTRPRAPLPYQLYFDESLGAPSIDTLARSFVAKNNRFLYSFAAMKLEEHGPGALFVMGKLRIRELVSSTPPPEPFDGAAMDRMATLVWVGPAKDGAAGAAQGSRRPPIMSYDRLHGELASHIHRLPEFIGQCSKKAGIPLVFLANPNGKYLGGLSKYCRAPKISTKSLEEHYIDPEHIYTKKGSDNLPFETYVMFPGIFFDLGAKGAALGAAAGYEELYGHYRRQGERYLGNDVFCMNLDRDKVGSMAWDE